MKAVKKILPFLLAVQMAIFALPITTLADKQQQNFFVNVSTDNVDIPLTDSTDEIAVPDSDNKDLPQTDSTDETAVPDSDNENLPQTEGMDGVTVSDDNNENTQQSDEYSNVSLFSLIMQEQTEDVLIDRTAGIPEGLTDKSFYVKEVISQILGTDSSEVYSGKILYSPDNDSYRSVGWDDIITFGRTYETSSFSPYKYGRYGSAYFIVGSNADDQLDNVNNVKYRITVYFKFVNEEFSKDILIDRTDGIPEGLTKNSFYVKEAISKILGTDISEEYNGEMTYSRDDKTYHPVEWNEVITLLDSSLTSNINYGFVRKGSEQSYFILKNTNADGSINNVKYTVNTYFKLFEDEFAENTDFKLYNAAQNEIQMYNEYSYSMSSDSDVYYYTHCTISPDILGENECPMIRVSLPSGYSSANVSAYEGLIYNEAGLSSAVDITSKILGDGSSYQMKKGGDISYSYFNTDVTFAVTVNDGKRVLIPINYIVSKGNNSVSLNISNDTGLKIKNVYVSLDSNDHRYYRYLDVYETDSFSNLNINAYAKYYFFDKDSGSSTADASKVKFACWGMYNTEEEAISKGAENIKDTLISNGYTYNTPVDLTKCREITGYLKDNTPVKIKEIYVTVIDDNGLAYHDIQYVGIIDKFPGAVPVYPHSASDDTYFNIVGTMADKDSDTKKSLNFYRVGRQNDSYFGRGYQTVLILDNGTPVTSETIYPVFTTGDNVRMRTLINGVQSPSNQISGESPIAFDSGKAIHYAALSESGNTLKNYLVTFVTQNTGGPKLFVNAMNDTEHLSVNGNPQREVILNSEYDYHHDIFFANIGDEMLTGINVTLSDDAKGVKLDPYWTVIGTSVKELNPFTKTGTGMDNIAKVRLVPDNEETFGDITGTLTISADNGDSVVIDLTGTAGVPKIITDKIFDGVKYVPYSCVIMTNSMYASNAMSFRISEGTLPSGIELRKNGELYGIPMEAGTFTFTVEAKYIGNDKLNSNEYTTYHEYTINVKDNSDENVDSVNGDPQGYTLTDRVSKYITVYYNGMNGNLPNVERIEVESDLFRSEGSYSGEFIAFYIDGQKLTEGEDYTAEEGSTKIVIQAQTFGHVGITGDDVPHTLAAEFRTENKTNELRRSAQNVYLNYVETKGETPDDPSDNPGGNPSDNPGGNPSGNPGGNPSNNPGEGSVIPNISNNFNVSSNNESVTAFFTIVDTNGKAIPNLSLELRSTPKYAETDSSGLVKFDSVEFGRHTIYIKDSTSGERISKSFRIKSGSETGIKENVITAKVNEPIFIKIEFNGKEINFLSADIENVSAGAGAYNDGEIIRIDTLNYISLKEEIIILISLISVTIAVYFSCKNRKNNR